MCYYKEVRRITFYWLLSNLDFVQKELKQVLGECCNELSNS